MASLDTSPSSVVSSRLYAQILGTPALAELVVPEGLLTSPYEILHYDATLILHDPLGRMATFARTQRIRFRQDGVGAILDHAWGDGITLVAYEQSAGEVMQSLRDEDHRHLVIRLKRPMARGEALRFQVKRTAMEAFTAEEEWLETTIDHPIVSLRRTIIFPPERPCRSAVLYAGETARPLPITRQADGRTKVVLDLFAPCPDTRYIIRWTW